MVSSEAVMKKLEIGYSSNLRKNLLLKFAKTRRNFWANHSHFPKLRFTCLFPVELPCIMIPDHDIISDFRYLTPKDLGFLFSTIYIHKSLDFHYSWTSFHTCLRERGKLQLSELVKACVYFKRVSEPTLRSQVACTTPVSSPHAHNV